MTVKGNDIDVLNSVGLDANGDLEVKENNFHLGSFAVEVSVGGSCDIKDNTPVIDCPS